MSDLFESIKRGLEEAVAHSKGEKTGVNLKAISRKGAKGAKENQTKLKS